MDNLCNINKTEDTMLTVPIEDMIVTEDENAVPDVLRSEKMSETKPENLVLQGKEDVKIEVEMLAKPNSFIPKEEQAEELTVSSKYSCAKEIGYFSPVVGMAQLKNILDDSVYAAIRVNDKGTRFIQYCQKYDNGTFSPRMSIVQSDLIFVANSNFNIGEVEFTELKPKFKKIIIAVTDDYLGKYNGNKVLKIQEILKALYGALGKLPVYKESVEATPEQFYIQVAETLKNCCPEGAFPWIYHKSYFALLDDRLEYLAQEMKITAKILLKKLNEYNFLYIAPSSKGYQSKVRVCENETQWAYCILRLEYIGEVKKIGTNTVTGDVAK